MELDIHFISGRVVRVYDDTVETPEEGLAVVANITGWVEIGGCVFHTRQIECLNFVDPDTTEEAGT